MLVLLIFFSSLPANVTQLHIKYRELSSTRLGRRPEPMGWGRPALGRSFLWDASRKWGGERGWLGSAAAQELKLHLLQLLISLSGLEWPLARLPLG